MTKLSQMLGHSDGFLAEFAKHMPSDSGGNDTSCNLIITMNAPFHEVYELMFLF